MELEQTSKLSASVRKDAKRVEPGPTVSIADNLSCTDDVEYTQRTPTIEDDARMSSPLSLTSSSASTLPQQPRHHNGAFSLVTTDDDFSSRESPPELEMASLKRLPAKNRARLSRKISEYVSTSTSPPPSSSMPMPRVRVEVHPFPDSAKGAASKSLSVVRPHPRSSQSSISNNQKRPLLKNRRTRQHPSLDTSTVSDPKSLHRLSLSTPPIKTPASPVDRDSLSTLEYDLDRDPTQEAYDFPDQFRERSPFSAVLSARFIHAHLFERLSDSAQNDEPTDSEADPVTEFIEPAALGSVGSHDAASPSYTLDSAAALANPDPTPAPGYGDFDLEGTVHIADPFTVPSMDDVINHQPWGPDAETMIDPSILGGAAAFPGPSSPSPDPTTFRDFHSWKRAHTPSPSLAQPALTIRVPSCTFTSTSESNSAYTPGRAEGSSGGGKAKFYKKGTLQTPPHLSNSQRPRSSSAKTSESVQISRQPSPSQTISAGSPLTELTASDFLTNGVMSTSSIVTPNAVDEDATVIGSGSGTPLHANSINKVTSIKQKSSTDEKGPYRIVAVNEVAYCHQCRRATPHPKMHCRACAKLYCIMCIVKRYHDIEFHQFKKDFDCPSCLGTCNCTACCDKRKEVYITTRHIRFDKETMAKLLSGGIRSLPHLSGSFAGPREKLKPGQDPVSSRYRKPPLITRKEKTSARRRRSSNRRDSSDDDYDESDAPTTSNVSVRAKPTQAALQTQKMLEESGRGRYWGAVYSLGGERIGMSYVGSNLQNITVQGDGISSVAGYSRSPSWERRKRVYVGRWQDAWGFRPESPGDSLSDENHANKRSKNNKEARFYYVGNQNVIKAWRKARSVQRPPVALLHPADDFAIYPSPFDKACDPHEAADSTPDGGIPNDGEDEDDNRSFWIMEDRSSPKKGDLPLLVAAETSRPGPDNVSGILDAFPISALEPCGQQVTQEDLVKAVTSGLRAVGTTVLLPQPPPPPSSLTS